MYMLTVFSSSFLRCGERDEEREGARLNLLFSFRSRVGLLTCVSFRVFFFRDMMCAGTD